jgi:hypothetical protein
MAHETAAHISRSYAVVLQCLGAGGHQTIGQDATHLRKIGTNQITVSAMPSAAQCRVLSLSCSCTVDGWSMLVGWRAFLGVGAVPLIAGLGCRVFV